MAGRRVLFLLILSLGNPRHPSPANGLQHTTMAGIYQCQTPCQDQPPEESCISSITTPPPNQAGTMLQPGPFHVINPSSHLVYSPPVLS